MFIYCFDKEEKEKLDKTLILLSHKNLADKDCWIFAIPKNSKFKYKELDTSKCLISKKLKFQERRA